MNLLISIDEEIYRHAQNVSEDSNDEWNAMRAIANGTPIPDNATNGDVIKAMFPNVKTELGVDKVIFARGLNNVTPFSEDWWNAKYQKGGK